MDEDQKFAEESPLPPPELAEQGVYCDGCHTIEADWQRSKEELTPPNCSVDAMWEVKSFGSLDPEADRRNESGCAGETDRSKASGKRRAAGAIGEDRSQIVRRRHPPIRQPQKPAAEEKDALETAAALRVPFGRGPKDRAFREERAQKEKEKSRRGKRGRR